MRLFGLIITTEQKYLESMNKAYADGEQKYRRQWKLAEWGKVLTAVRLIVNDQFLNLCQKKRFGSENRLLIDGLKDNILAEIARQLGRKD